jgi:hypothetical protein
MMKNVGETVWPTLNDTFKARIRRLGKYSVVEA